MAASGSGILEHIHPNIETHAEEQPAAIAALALDFILQLPAEQPERSAQLSGVLAKQTKLFEPAIEKLQGQIASDASSDFVVLFRKPVSAVICALSLHRMFAALSQALPELERIQLRIGVHANANHGDDTQAQQKCIEMAHKLKELAPGGSILVSRAVVSTIDEAVPLNLRLTGEHKLTAAAEPVAIFDLIPTPMHPLSIKQKSHFAQLRLPLAAALALFIIGGTGYGYIFDASVIEWPRAFGFETRLKITQHQPDSATDLNENSVSPRTATVGVLQRVAAPPAKSIEPSPTVTTSVRSKPWKTAQASGNTAIYWPRTLDRVADQLHALDAMRLGVGPNAPQLSKDSFDLYVVKPRDTLRGLAKRYFGEPHLWSRIHEANLDVISDPDRIFAGHSLRIPRNR